MMARRLIIVLDAMNNVSVLSGQCVWRAQHFSAAGQLFLFIFKHFSTETQDESPHIYKHRGLIFMKWTARAAAAPMPTAPKMELDGISFFF